MTWALPGDDENKANRLGRRGSELLESWARSCSAADPRVSLGAFAGLCLSPGMVLADNVLSQGIFPAHSTRASSVLAEKKVATSFQGGGNDLLNCRGVFYYYNYLPPIFFFFKVSQLCQDEKSNGGAMA